MFDTVIVNPLLNLLIFLYSIVPFHDFGLAVISITIVVRAILWPLSAKALHSQKALKALQPEIDKIKKKHKGNPQALQKAMTELYKEKEINPFSSCLPTLLQLPILIGLYFVFIKFKDPGFIRAVDEQGSFLRDIYSFVRNFGPVKEVISANGSLNTSLLGLADLAKPNVILAVLAGATQFVQTKLMTPSKPQDQMQQMMARMVYIFPLVTIAISFTLPAALPLYWAASTTIAAYQQWLIMHKEVSIFEHMRIKKVKGKSK